MTGVGSVGNVCRQARQDAQGSLSVKVLRQGVHERLQPGIRIEWPWRMRLRLLHDRSAEDRGLLLGLLQLRRGILPDMPVVVPGEEQAYGVRRVLLQQILYHDEI